MSSVQQRWKLIVDFVRKQEVSAIFLSTAGILPHASMAGSFGFRKKGLLAKVIFRN